jgi:hypothetical protein
MNDEALQQVALIIGRQAIDNAKAAVENKSLADRLAIAEAEVARLRAEAHESSERRSDDEAGPILEQAHPRPGGRAASRQSDAS